MSIVGAGGIGKTTVALAVAEEAIESFKDGVWLVDFARLKESSLVPNTIAAATGLVVHSSNVMPALCRFLRNRQTLLVLDNCEHMTDTIGPCVAQILEEAPRVRFSRPAGRRCACLTSKFTGCLAFRPRLSRPI